MFALLLSCATTDPDPWADSAEPTLDTTDTADSGDSGADTADSGADTADSGGDTADSGADTADSGGDTADSGVDTGDSGTTDTGEEVYEVAADAPADWSLPDLNPVSPRYGEAVSPRDYISRVSGYYFIHST